MRIFVILAILAFSCSNPKERIVERQKEIKKKRADLYERTYNRNASRLDEKKADSISALDAEYDSLEMELKKY